MSPAPHPDHAFPSRASQSTFTLDAHPQLLQMFPGQELGTPDPNALLPRGGKGLPSPYRETLLLGLAESCLLNHPRAGVKAWLGGAVDGREHL